MIVVISQNLEQEEYFVTDICLLVEGQDEVIIVSFVMRCTIPIVVTTSVVSSVNQFVLLGIENLTNQAMKFINRLDCSLRRPRRRIYRACAAGDGGLSIFYEPSHEIY